MKELPSKQIEAVLRLPAPKRYEHFVKQVADWEEAWGLYSDGWALAGSESGDSVFPLWPAKEYAALCATGEWSTYIPKAIPLDDVLEALLPRMNEDGTLAGVFYTPADKGIMISPSQLLKNLRAEAGRYE